MKNNIRIYSLYLFCGLLSISMLYPATTFAGRGDVQLYGDISYLDSDADSDSWESTVDLFAAYKFDTTNSVLIEMVVEKGPSETHFEVERWWIKHSFSQVINLYFGRFHTPIGYWNTNYHHGAYFYDSVDRPFYLEFEDDHGFLPVHFVGLKLDGDSHLNSGRFDYQLIVANNQKLEISSHSDSDALDELEFSPQPSEIFNENLFVGFNVSYKPDNLPISVGFFVSDQTISGEDITIAGQSIQQSADIFEQQLMSLYLNGKWGKFDVLAEYLDMDIKDIISTQMTQQSTAGYLQLGYQISELSKITYRAAALEFERQNTFFQLLSEKAKVRYSVAYRYDINLNTVIKLQASHNIYKHDLLDSENELSLQLAFFVH